MKGFEGRRIGLIGAGAIGGAVIDRLIAVGMRRQVMATDPHADKEI